MKLPALLVFTLCSVTPAIAAFPPYPKLELDPSEQRLSEPVLTPASEAAEKSIAQFRTSDAFEIRLWAAEPLLSNPVAFDFDEQGRLFVSETHRYRSSVLDIRGYMPILEHELATETIEDRLKLIDNVFGDRAGELAIEGEVIRLVEDTDGDGVADSSRVFADGFNSKLDGIASGVLARHGKVWFANIPSLWQFETDASGTQAAARRELIRGFGVRFGYTGHDYHGLILGPDGKLYSSIGDRATNATSLVDGSHVKLLDQGAVFRCNLDGSDFELVAWGLRNPQELAFNEYGDLFTGDNDCDNGDLERLVQVVEGGDSGWRVGYQFAPLGRAGPWMSENLWKPDFPGRAAYLLPPLANIEDGPSGIVYYPGSGLSADFDQTLFVTHFKGSIARSGVQSYKLAPAGASYAVTDSKPFVWGMLPTDVTFAPDGRFYFVDWVEGWPKSNRGRVYSLAPKNPSAAQRTLQAEVQVLLAGGIRAAPAEQLIALLAHVDQRVRTESQFELAHRGAAQVAPLAELAADASANLFARLHALWALGMLQRENDTALATLDARLGDPTAEVRAQAAKLAGDHRLVAHVHPLLALLADPAPRVRFFAAQSLGKLRDPLAIPALIDLLRHNDNADAYLRHAAVHALTQIDHRAALAEFETDPAAAVRLGVLLVYRRLQEPRLTTFLNDTDPYLVREAALAINDEPIPDALPALAARLGQGDANDEALQLRAINARLRVGRPEDAAALAAYAADSVQSVDLRSEALQQLSTWPDPFHRDRIVGVYRPLPDRDPAPAVAALKKHLPALLADKHRSVQLAALAAIESLAVTAAIPHLQALVGADGQPGEVRATALRLLDKLGDDRLLEAVAVAGASDEPELRMATLPLLARLSPQQALPVLRRMAETGTPREQQAAFKAIADLADPAAAHLLAAGLRRLTAGEVPYLAQFELLDAAEASTTPAVQSALAEVKSAWETAGDKLAPFRGALAGGDARRGWRMFNEHPVLACTRCHKVNGEGGEAGPDLSTIAEHQSLDYILEAIIDPNATIAPGFDVVAFTLKDGGFVAGTIAEETAEKIVVRDAAGERHEIAPANVAERNGAPSSMPPIFGLVLKRDELRDLMAFMRTLKPREETGEGEAAARATHGE